MSRRVAWSPPTSFDGFELGARLGAGGMGTVYRARDVLLDRMVAIKIADDAGRHLHAHERFATEIRAVARIRHPNVVDVYRAGTVEGRPYLAQELLTGVRLDELPRPTPWPSVVAIGRGLARALAATHACGVLHRDLKPANVMILGKHRVKLFDFGLAQLVGAPPIAWPAGSGSHDDSLAGVSSNRLTGRGGVAGTPAYIAPELWTGGEASIRTDVYALGLVMYELLVGDLPHRHLTRTKLSRAVVSYDLPRIESADTGAPSALCDLIDRCVARDPDARPGSATIVRDELDRISAGARRSVTASPRAAHDDTADRAGSDDVPTETLGVPLD